MDRWVMEFNVFSILKVERVLREISKTLLCRFECCYCMLRTWISCMFGDLVNIFGKIVIFCIFVHDE